MSHKKLPLRISMIALGGVALSLSVLRCSPLSLSQSKLRSTTGGSATPAGPNGPGTVKPIGGTALGPGDQSSALTNIPASVQEFSRYKDEVAELPADQRLSLGSDSTPEALESFKSTRSVTVHFGGHGPDHCKAYLGLSMSDLMIANYGWNSAVNPIATDCSPTQDGNWKISVSQNVSADTWALISPSIEALTIFAANNPHMTVVGTGPAPQPTGGVHLTPKP